MFKFVQRLKDRNSAWRDFESIFRNTQYDVKFVRKYFYVPFHRGFNHGYDAAARIIRHYHGPKCTAGWNVQFNGCIHKLMHDAVAGISNKNNNRPSDIFEPLGQSCGTFFTIVHNAFLDRCFVTEEKDGLSHDLSVVFDYVERFAKNVRILLHSVLNLEPTKHEDFKWMVEDITHEAKGVNHSPNTRAFILKIATCLDRGWKAGLVKTAA